METNRMIAEFLGWENIWQGNTALIGTSPDCATEQEVPDFQGSDAAAITLLPELENKGFDFMLIYERCLQGYEFILTDSGRCRVFGIDRRYPTVALAITAAIGEMIGREGKE